MTSISTYIFFSLFILSVQGDLRLQIVKSTEDFLTPVATTVQERTGTTFSLICELISSDGSNNMLDDNLAWIRGENIANQTRVKKTIPSRHGINKSEKKFDPLTADDTGQYFCISRKFNLSTDVTLLVIENGKWNEGRPMRETSYCNDQMFYCMSNGLCIISHYVCDGKPDCRDGSDETEEKCTKDPCKDKIPCDDGRCIPSSWCCDRHHDLNCNVTNRPKCCQSMVLSESYEELEYGYPNMNHAQHNGARYLFISVCIVSILFSIVLLLLIVSKVVIFAKKSALQQQQLQQHQQRHGSLCENIALRNHTNVNIIRANFTPTNIYTLGGGGGGSRGSSNSRTPRISNCTRNIIIDASDANDPLLFDTDRYPMAFNDQPPPSYIDVLRNNRLINEPPPPYTSREILNTHNEGIQERNNLN